MTIVTPEEARRLLTLIQKEPGPIGPAFNSLAETVLALWEVLPDPFKLDKLADWLDITDRPGQGKEVQNDLRLWAKNIREAQDAASL